MRDSRTIIAIILLLLPAWFASSSTRPRDEASSLFKAKCAACHGADGSAKTPLGKKENIPSFSSNKVRSATDSELQDFILNGGKLKKPSHVFAGKGVSEQQAKELAGFIRLLGHSK